MKACLLSGFILLLCACNSQGPPSVRIDFAALPYAEPVQFKMLGQAEPSDQPSNRRFYDCALNAQGDVFAGLPMMGLFAFKAPDWKSSNLTPEGVYKHGPTALAISPKGLLVVFAKDAKVWLTTDQGNEEFKMPTRDTLVGNGGNLLVPSQGGKLWSRYALEGELLANYPLQQQGMPMLTSSDSAGRFAALSPKGVLEVFENNGTVLAHLTLPRRSPSSQTMTYKDMQVRGDRIYFLYQCGGKRTAHILVIDLKGTVRNHWMMGMAGDQLRVNDQTLLIFERDLGNAYSMALPKN